MKNFTKEEIKAFVVTKAATGDKFFCDILRSLGRGLSVGQEQYIQFIMNFPTADMQKGSQDVEVYPVRAKESTNKYYGTKKYTIHCVTKDGRSIIVTTTTLKKMFIQLLLESKLATEKDGTLTFVEGYNYQTEKKALISGDWNGMTLSRVSSIC